MILLGLVAGTSVAQIHRTSDAVRRADLAREATLEEKLMVPMRDGVRLDTKVYRPLGVEGPLPTIFWRTPYNTSPLAGSNPNRPSALLKYALDSIRRGYAFVIQNERGKFFSEGTWEILGRPRTDGYDALSWIADQPWSNGRVATLGCSSTAEWQMALAAMKHPAHAAAVPMGQGAGIGKMGSFYEQGNFYRGGAIQLPMLTWLFGEQSALLPRLEGGYSQEQLLQLGRYHDLATKGPQVNWRTALWQLPLAELAQRAGGVQGQFEEFVRRMPGSEAWSEGGLYRDDEGFGVPALWVNSWYDLSVGPNLALYEHVRSHADPSVRDHQYMIVAPTLHCAMYRLRDPLIVGERKMGATAETAIDGRLDGLDDVLFGFLDRYVRGDANGFEQQNPKVRYFQMGENRWQTSPDWPPKAVTKTLHLASDEGANSLFGDGRLQVASTGDRRDIDSFTYDPTVPVPTMGGNFCCLGDYPPGAFDQRAVEARQDVLVFTSEPLEKPLAVAGWVHVVLHASSSAPDTDLTVKLVDVAPDGTAYNLDDSILRMRYREAFDRTVWMEPGEVYEVRVGPLSTASTFGVGHRIRLEVSSSNFPRYDRNLNTGGDNITETKSQVARNTIHHSRAYPSRIELPVVQAAATGAER